MAANKNSAYRVLIVQDDAALAGLLAGLLRHPARSIEIRDSAFEALQFVRHNPVDLVVLDPVMAGRDDAQLTGQIRKWLPRAHIVLCTGYLAGDLARHAETVRSDRNPRERFAAGEVLQIADTYSSE